MGGVRTLALPFRDEVRVKFFIGERDVTREIASYLERGFIRINTANIVVTVCNRKETD